MKYSVCKVFTFDAAHMLPEHDGKCRNLHGHTYRVEVMVDGPLVAEGPKRGMVIDFGDIKAVWRKHIEPLVDHRYLNETLPVKDTTAEAIAHWMLVQFRTHLTDLTGREFFAGDMGVRVWETPTSWALAT